MPSPSPFIVAEMSANHLGSFERARELVLAAADAGADGFKVQVWEPDTMCIDRTQTIMWAGKRVSLMQLYREAWTPWEWLPDLFAIARNLGMVPFGAAFDHASVDYLEDLKVDRHKVASFELTDLPLIRYMASKGKPMILSTGMATLQEIADAQRACGDLQITSLKCTSAYPAHPADANLAILKYGPGQWGLSDHTMGIGVACAAAALGATMIEKHLTLSRADGGPDSGFSMEPAEFKQMVTECRRAAAAIGEPTYGPGPNESTALRRSVWVARDVKAGETAYLGSTLTTARPALGMPIAELPGYEGGIFQRDVKGGTPFERSMVLA